MRMRISQAPTPRRTAPSKACDRRIAVKVVKSVACNLYKPRGPEPYREGESIDSSPMHTDSRFDYQTDW